MIKICQKLFKKFNKNFCINEAFYEFIDYWKLWFIGTNLIFQKKIKFFCIDKVKNRYIKDKNFFSGS